MKTLHDIIVLADGMCDVADDVLDRVVQWRDQAMDVGKLARELLAKAAVPPIPPTPKANPLHSEASASSATVAPKPHGPGATTPEQAIIIEDATEDDE